MFHTPQSDVRSSGVVRGQSGQLPPVGLDSDKNIVGSVVYTARQLRQDSFVLSCLVRVDGVN